MNDQIARLTVFGLATLVVISLVAPIGGASHAGTPTDLNRIDRGDGVPVQGAVGAALIAATDANVAIEYTPETPNPGDSVQFYLQTTGDVGFLESVEWDFDGDGETDATGDSTTYAFDHGGTHQLTAFVRFSDGSEVVEVTEVHVNKLPNVKITVQPEQTATGEEVRFDASDSIDPDGSIVSYQWDFMSGGEFTDTNTGGESVFHSFPKRGEWTVTVRVEDNNGAATIHSRTVVVVNDKDGDGLRDSQEQQLGTDPTAADTDGDGLSDSVELEKETNPTIADTDSDGLDDGTELEIGTNPVVADTDDDGLSDEREYHTLSTDPTRADTDGDGLDDGAELDTGTDPTTADTDSDGLDDGAELDTGTDPTTADTDGDDLNDSTEHRDLSTDPTMADTDGDGLDDDTEHRDLSTDPTMADTDGDGLDDGAELDNGADPTTADTDGDGLDDGAELDNGSDPTIADTDGDTLDDGYEVRRDMSPTTRDTDGDGLSDVREHREMDTDPRIADTDDDGLDDGAELKNGTDPTTADTDGDGLDDGAELKNGSNPTDPDTDTDLFPDGSDPMQSSFWVPTGFGHLIAAIGLWFLSMRR